MKPVIQIETECRVVILDARQTRTGNGRERVAEWDELAAAIDERAHYVGPVLEGILHHDDTVAWPWNLRDSV